MSSFPDLREFLKILENLRPLCPPVARVTKTCPPPEASLVPQILADRWCAPCYGPRGCRGFSIVYACAAASGLQVVLCPFRFPSGLDFVNGNRGGALWRRAPVAGLVRACPSGRCGVAGLFLRRACVPRHEPSCRRGSIPYCFAFQILFFKKKKRRSRGDLVLYFSTPAVRLTKAAARPRPILDFPGGELRM